MSDSVRPHRQPPTRLPSPWDFPSKNTGVDCHFLLQCMKVKSEVAQLCLTLSDLMDYSLPGSSVHGIFQARVLEWGAIAFSNKFPSQLLLSNKFLLFIFFKSVFLLYGRGLKICIQSCCEVYLVIMEFFLFTCFAFLFFLPHGIWGLS